jgi:hypothetical protein
MHHSQSIALPARSCLKKSIYYIVIPSLSRNLALMTSAVGCVRFFGFAQNDGERPRGLVYEAARG